MIKMVDAEYGVQHKILNGILIVENVFVLLVILVMEKEVVLVDAKLIQLGIVH